MRCTMMIRVAAGWLAAYCCRLLPIVLMCCPSPKMAAGTITAPPIAWSVQTTDSYAPDIAPAPGGGVYVTSTGTEGSLTRYSASGGQLWRVGLSSQIRGEAVRSDAAGNVYMAGNTYTSLDGPNQGNGDVDLRKYTSNGTLIWGRQFGTPRGDWPAGMAVAADGTVSITSGGWQTNYGTPPANSYTTLRQYSATGTAGWITDLNTQDGSYPGNSSSASQATVLDSHGNLFCVFSNYTPTNWYMYLAKVSPTGQLLWIKPQSGFSNIFDMAIDASDNLYVASGGLYKYSPSGDLLWKDTLSSSVFATCVGPDGTIYAGGNSGAVMAVDASGQQVWSTNISLPGKGLTFYSMTYSGQQLFAAGQVITGSYWTGNDIVAMSAPSTPLPGAAVGGTALLVLCAVTRVARRRLYIPRA